MDIKLIENKDFMQLAELTVDMYASMELNINAFQALNTLITSINNTKGFTAIGLYDGTALAGFITGHENGPGIFYFSGIYMVLKNTEKTKDLIEYALNMVKEREFKYWEFDATNPNIASIMEKYGAKPIYTRYRKGIE